LITIIALSAEKCDTAHFLEHKNVVDNINLHLCVCGTVQTADQGVGTRSRCIGKGHKSACCFIGKGIKTTHRTIGKGNKTTLIIVGKGNSKCYTHLKTAGKARIKC
jgi:hypothetical protein